MKWTTKEEQFLLENYNKLSKTEVYNTLKKSRDAVRKKAQRLGLTKPPKPWTQKEIDTLKELHPLTRKKLVLEALPGRTWSAIQRMSSELKVHRTRGLDYVKGKLQKGEISDFELGYLVGIIDGEGCICMHRSKNTFQIKVEIGNTFIPLAEKIHELIGGNQAPGRVTAGGKESWIIYHSSLFGVYETLKLLKAHLFVKRKQAELMLEFCERRIKSVQGLYDERDFQIWTEMCALQGKKRKEGVVS